MRAREQSHGIEVSLYGFFVAEEHRAVRRVLSHYLIASYRACRTCLYHDGADRVYGS